MILVTVGMNDYPFDLLFQALDELQPKLGDRIVMQIGNSKFQGKNTECFSYVTDGKMQELYDETDLLISHAGVGSILNGVNRNIPMVLIPRHVTDIGAKVSTQLYVAEKIEKMGRAVVLRDLKDLYEVVCKAKQLKFPKYEKDKQLVNWLDDLLTSISAGNIN